MDGEEIEQRAEKTLREASAYHLPVQVDKVARTLNLTMRAAPLGDACPACFSWKASRCNRL
jgi:hypothetical protein